MRLLFVSFWNLLAAATWPLRALARLAFGRPPPAWVEVELRGTLEDFAPPRPWWLRRAPLHARTLASLRETFERVQRTPACRGIVLRVHGPHGTNARLTALAELIGGVRKAGKEVVVWAEALDGRAYGALCGASRLHLPPGGTLDLTGTAVELTAAGAALQRFGVRPEFFRREAHKTAPELFTRAEPSDVQRKTAEALLDQSFESLVASLTRRGLDEGRARAAVDGGPYLGRGAAEAGLLDRPLFWDELTQELAPEGQRRGPRLGSERQLRAGGKRPRGGFRPFRRPRLVAVVPVRGVIRSGKSGAMPGMGRLCGHESVASALQRAARHPRVAAILLYVDSRGGSAQASELIWHEVRTAAKKKPVIAYLDGVAASGGYYVACGADRLLASPLSLVGSIGVFFGRFDLSQALGRLGVHAELLTRGAHAGLNWPTRPLSPAEREAAETLVEAIYQDFLGVVAQARHRTVDEVRPLAGGRVYTGRTAREAGLVDATVPYAEALREAAERGGIAAAAPPVVVFEEAARGAGALSGLAGAVAALARPQVWALHAGPGVLDDPFASA